MNYIASYNFAKPGYETKKEIHLSDTHTIYTFFTSVPERTASLLSK